MNEHLLNSSGQARARHTLGLGLDRAVMDGRQDGWCSRSRSNILLEKTDVEHIMKLGAWRQLETDGDGVDQLDDTIRPEKAGLQLALGDLRQRSWSAMTKAKEHKVAHNI